MEMINPVQESTNKIIHMQKLIYPLFFLFLLLTVKTQAQDLVYTPKNPAFGGNTFNYQWLLSSAQAQDTYEDDSRDLFESSFDRDPVSDFEESLNRQILSQLSRQIVSNQFGEDVLENGTYVLGDYQIEIGDADSGINISILDTKTGATTTVSVPSF